MVLPLYASLEKLDHTLLEAASDLGSPPLQGVLADHLSAVASRRHRRLDAGLHPGDRRVRHPRSLGGSDTLMIGKTLWDEFFHNRDWPMASTVAVILLLVLVVPIVFFQNTQARRRERDR